MNIKLILFILLISTIFKAQTINMYFPHFAGKKYDFIIFQGNLQKTVYQGIIPKNGKFKLIIPKEYEKYIGMSRWLITGTKEGGGLDMYIPGQDFSVSCMEAIPDENNIIYLKNSSNNELNNLYKEQEKIIIRYNTMLLAKNIFDSTDKNYPTFVDELMVQEEAYRNFQFKLREKSDYISQFLQIVNITKGISSNLYEKEQDHSIGIIRYIQQDMNWKYLYTSGHWNNVIDTWVRVHINVIKDINIFKKNFKDLTYKINSSIIYLHFTERVLYILNLENNTDYAKIVNSFSSSR